MAGGSTTIRGVTVTIGADTKDFINGLKKIDKEVSYTSKQANELQKQLAVKYDTAKWSKANSIVQKDLQDVKSKAEAIRKEMEEISKTSGVDSDSYKKLAVELEKSETQAAKLEKQLQDLDKIKLEGAYQGVKKLSSALETAGKNTRLLSGAAVGAIAGVTKLAKDAVATGDEIQTLADKYNLSAEAIQRWNYIALQSDVSSDQLYKSMTKVRDAVGTALSGSTNNATKAIEALVGDVSKVPADTEGAFNTIIMALSNVKDSTMQAYYANEIFGEKVATDLIPLLKQGSDNLNGLNKEFEQVGYLSNEQVKSLSEFDNEMNNFNTRLTNAKTQLGIALLPIFERFINILENNIIPAIQKLTDWFDRLDPKMQDLIVNGLLLAAALSPVLTIFGKIIGKIPTLINLFKSLNANVIKTQLGFAALAGSMVLALDLIGNWSKMSTVEKILKTLAVAALVAAAAITVFHASWSLGIAVGAIAAGVVAGIAAIKSAADNIGVDMGDMSSKDDIYKVATTSSLSPQDIDYGTYNEDNSVYNIDISLNATGNLDYDAKSLANEVIKQIQVAKASSGR